MKYIFLNLKRFDVPKALGGVNGIAKISDWAGTIVNGTGEGLASYDPDKTLFAMFFPEAHLLNAAAAAEKYPAVQIGSQGVFRKDVASGVNFGAYTTSLPAAAAKELGCSWALIGHCEERNDKAGILKEAGVTDTDAVNRILNQEVKAAQNQGLKVLYCIGEKDTEQERWQEVLKAQLETGLQGADLRNVVIGYEPVWSIGPGKTPAGREYIQMIAQFVRQIFPGISVVYGGGLKKDNAEMLSSIPEIDGGLIALTRFTGDIGFYPEEYLEIIDLYMKGALK